MPAVPADRMKANEAHRIALPAPVVALSCTRL